MSDEENRPLGLYIHIPFCDRKCDYCDFVSYSMDSKAQQLYLEALFAEIDMVRSEFFDKTFDSIFIGGGTPSIVYEGFIASLARKLYSSFHFLDNTEFTIEVNPSSFTREKFFEYVQAGVNRISVGVQCLDEKLLREHGRIQSMENIEETFKMLNTSQFPNINSDVMIGLPGQTVDSVVDTINYLLKQNVKHISTYTLQVERHTMLYSKLRKGRLSPMKDKTMIEIYNRIDRILTKAGFHRYEISNYAKPGFECKHNLKYWDDSVSYLGLGVAAHSYIDDYRYYNTKRLDTYIDDMKDGKSAVYSREYVSDEERREERIMLSLRTTKGLDLEKFKKDFNEDLLRTHTDVINRFIDKGMVEVKDNFLRIKNAYFAVSNSIIVELI